MKRDASLLQMKWKPYKKPQFNFNLLAKPHIDVSMGFVQTDQAIEKLIHENVVALPTETVYGLAGRYDSEKAIKKIFETKQRPSFDPLILHVEDARQAQLLAANWSDAHEIVTKEFWPGPVTLVLEKKSHVSDLITSGMETVAVRSPHHPKFQEVLKGVGVPLAAPSANMFSRTSPTSAVHVLSEFESAVPVVDGGNCQAGIESTILYLTEISLSDRTAVGTILRRGLIDEGLLKKAFEKHHWVLSIGQSQVVSPGQLKAHYQPAVPLVLYDPGQFSETQVLEELANKYKNPKQFSLPSDPYESARILYQQLRLFSSDECDLVMCQWRQGTQATHPWDAIFDRLVRAASFQLLSR